MLAADFESDDLPDAAFEPEAEGLLADFAVVAVDLAAVDFAVEDVLLAAGLELDDLLEDADGFAADFAAGFAEADLLLLAEADLLAVVFLTAAVDFAEFLFVVAIALSLKFFLQLTQEFLR